MTKTTQEIYKIDGISVVIGEAVSKDFGLVPLVDQTEIAGMGSPPCQVRERKPVQKSTRALYLDPF